MILERGNFVLNKIINECFKIINDLERSNIGGGEEASSR